MRTLGAIAAVLLLLIAGVVVWYKTAYPTYSHRYRLRIAIEVDGNAHTGSSVIEISWVWQPDIPGVGPFIPQVGGQAAFVDLGSRGVVIAALGPGRTSQGYSDGSVSAVELAARAFGNQGTHVALPELEKLRGRRDLTADNMPRMLWFPNIADPKSAKRLFVKNIPTLLGPTARLTEASVEITTDPIVIDIDQKMPWFDLLKRRTGTNVIDFEYGFALAKSMFIGAASW